MTGWAFAVLCKHQEIQTEFLKEKKELEGIDLDINQENTDDGEGDEKLRKSIVKQKRAQPINTKFLKAYNLRIVKNQSGGSCFKFENNEAEDNESVNSEEKINKEVENKSQNIWMEINGETSNKDIQKYMNDICDIFIAEESSKGCLIEIKDMDKDKYNSIKELISKLNNDKGFPGTAYSYIEYLQKLNSE